jgi:thiamine-monophosphate kinase
VAVAGDLGRAARGLAILFDRFRDAAGTPIPADRTVLDAAHARDLDAQLRPVPPVALGIAAAEGGATALMDVSDGLALDARRLATASGVTLALDSSALGDDPAGALDGGEDHALLATFDARTALPDGFRPIGRVRAAAEAPLLVDGAAPVGRGGWDPYRDWDSARG